MCAASSTVDVDDLFRQAFEASQSFGGGGCANREDRDFYEMLDTMLPELVERDLATAWRRWYITTNQVQTSSGGNTTTDDECTLATCTSSVKKMNIDVYAVDEDVLGDVRTHEAIVKHASVRTTDGRRLHLCSDFCQEQMSNLALHDECINRKLERNNVSIVRERGNVYWCDRHRRAHVCVGQCRYRYTDEHGFEKCVLSGRELAAPIRHVFGDGTREAMTGDGDVGGDGADMAALDDVLDAVVDERDGREREVHNRAQATMAMAKRGRRSSTSAPTREYGSAYDRQRLIPLGNRGVRQARTAPAATTKRTKTTMPIAIQLSSDYVMKSRNTAAKRDRPRNPDATGGKRGRVREVDQDHWSVVDFDQRRWSNVTWSMDRDTFRRMYKNIYAQTDRLLFSEERSKLEEERARIVDEVAYRRMVNYRSEQLKRGNVVFLDEALRRGEEEVNMHWRPPTIVVGVGWLERLAAYYTMLQVEFVINVRALAVRVENMAKQQRRRLLTNGDSERRRQLDGFITVATSMRGHDEAKMVPSMLQLIRQGWEEAAVRVFVRDAFLQPIFFESAVMQELGVPEKACTRATTDIKQTVAAARDLRVSLADMQSTQMDFNDVVRTAPASVVELFLHKKNRTTSIDYNADNGGGSNEPPTPSTTTSNGSTVRWIHGDDGGGSNVGTTTGTVARTNVVT